MPVAAEPTADTAAEQEPSRAIPVVARNPDSGPDAGADEMLRSATYSMLGALLATPPDAAMLERLRAIGGGDSQDAGAGVLGEGWGALRAAAEAAEIEACREEHFELFIGLGRGQLVPYGSWYMTGFMMDKPLAVLRGDLARLGFERLESVKEPEDHAGALLETMAWLCAEGEHVTTQSRFFERHLAPWMKTFFKDLQQAKSARFYQAVGLFGEQFIAFEQKYLSMPA